MKSLLRVSDLHGCSRLAVDAALGLTDVVESMHHTILRLPWPWGAPVTEPASGITGLVYRSIRSVTRGVGYGLDGTLGRFAGDPEVVPLNPTRESAIALLNGVLGDHLALSHNPLAIPMSLRREGQVLTLERDLLRASLSSTSDRLVILVHGLCMNDLKWLREGHDHGAALAIDEGYTPLYLHYNSGLSIASNGQQFAQLLQRLVEEWPQPVRELVIIGHSMGGLLTRSALQYASASKQDWLRVLQHVVFLGTPHHGAPLERGGNWLDSMLAASPYTHALSRIGKVRSAGITDLRHGEFGAPPLDSVRGKLSQTWPKGLKVQSIAASLSRTPNGLRGKLLGDGLVPVASALGQHADVTRSLRIAKSRQWVGYDMGHLDLLGHEQVYAQILAGLRR
ncbi:MAG: hypothetical protein ABIY56_06020 [Dokdonella sp.]